MKDLSVACDRATCEQVVCERVLCARVGYERCAVTNLWATMFCVKELGVKDAC